MLKKLHVVNFAIIDEIELDFNSGMTVLTGQTGAGKSLIIDTISLLLGKRSDTDMIRYGEEKAIVEGIFEMNDEISSFLSEYDLPINTDLSIYRDISKSKSTAKINGVNISIQTLKALGIILGDIHVQNDTYRLFTKENYISLIDPKDNNDFMKYYNSYQIKYQSYLENYNKYNDILKHSKIEKDNLEYYEFAYKEISSMDLHKNEDLELEEKVSKLKNFDKIFQALKSAINSLENEYFSIDNIYEAKEEIKSIEKYDKAYQETLNKLTDSYYNLSDALSDIKGYINNLDYSEDELNDINDRLQRIENLKYKYHLDLNGLIEYQDNIKLKIDMIVNYDEVLEKSYKDLENAYNLLVKAAECLTNQRKKRSVVISKAIEELCKDLELPHTKFVIDFKECEYNNPIMKDIFTESGTDDVEFMISTNLGEPVKPLSKVASGGEMSRIMLAFKAFFANEAKLSLMVFDEIDTGVSGSVATEIAKKIKKISTFTQVLAITHLPQVAAMADNQLLIYKEEESGRTFAKVKLMDKDERIMQIAKMISGQKISSYAISAAKDLLDNKNVGE